MCVYGDVVTYRFDDLVVDAGAFRVLKGGEPVRIEPKALDLLIFLIERRERVVSKQELLDAVWKGTTVSDNALTRAIAQVRKVLGDDLHSPRYIQTVPTKGYRFIGEVDEEIERGASRPADVGPAVPTGSPSRAVAVGAMALIVVLALAAVGIRSALSILRRLSSPGATKTISAPRSLSLPARVFRGGERMRSFPSFSPDGVSIAYSADVAGTPHIFVGSIAGDDERQITNGDGETQPSWSPHGKEIAYAAPRQGGIWIVPVARDAAPRRLTPFGSRPSWSPDGNEIAFQSGDAIEYGWTAFDALPPSTIWRVDVRTGRMTAVTQPGRPAGGHGAPSWSPDGRRLAFSSSEVERCAIYTVAHDGSDIAVMVSDPRRLSSPQFTREGRALLYVFSGYDTSALMRLSISNDQMQAEGAPERLRGSSRGVMQHLAQSRDGSRLAWTLSAQASELVSAELNRPAATPAQLTNHTAARLMFPAFSPEGSKIAYCVVGADEESTVWSIDADGGNAKAVMPGPGLFKQHIGWLSSREVLYWAWSGNGLSMYAVSIVSGQVRVLHTLPRDASAPALSPDGSAVAYTRTLQGRTTVWINDRQVTNAQDLARNPVWSPTGRFVAVQLRGAGGIGIVPAVGGPLTVVKTFPGESHPYSWSPDEKAIAFAGVDHGVSNIYSVSLQGGAPRGLTNNTSLLAWLRSPAWSPDGKRIVYERGAPNANVWLSEQIRP